jgi:hypothetical protein
MLNKRQFSLGFLLIELSLIACALGMFRAGTIPDLGDIAPLLFLAGITLFGLAFGNLFERPILGTVFATIVIVVAAAMGPEFVAALIVLSIVLMLYLFACLLAAFTVTRTISAIKRLLQTTQLHR